mgnify:CR=1 FL=1
MNTKTQKINEQPSDDELPIERELPLKEKILNYSVALLLSLVGKLPNNAQRSLAIGFAKIYCFIPTVDRTVTFLQLKRFLGIKEPAQIATKVFYNAAMTLFESADFSRILNRHHEMIIPEDSELVDLICSNKEPVLVLTGHFGNWELFAAYLVRRGCNLSAIGRKGRREAFQNALVKIREGWGVKTIWREDDLQSTQNSRAIIKLFKTPGVIGGLIDQDTFVTSLPIEFFGEKVATPSSLAEIALRFNVKILLGIMIRQSDSKFLLRLKSPSEQSDVKKILTEYSLFMEENIKEHPEQWVWFHKRWRTTANGYRRSRQEYLKYLTETSNENR